jgi:hypothetical protein
LEEPLRVEIYGLFDPDTDELRYIGKANNAGKRLKTHLQDCKTRARPVNHWVRSLIKTGKLPVMRVLETVPADEWEQAERKLIAKYRGSANLLNLADGGAMPAQTAAQRVKAARASNAKQKANPAMARVNAAKRDMSRLLTKFMKNGDYFHAYTLRFRMRCFSADRPDLYGCWSQI